MWLELSEGLVRAQVTYNAISEELCWESLMSRRLATKDKHFAKICNKSAPQYLCELLPTTVGENSQRSLRNENDLKEMKGRTETFRESFIPDAIKRYNNNNQKGNVIDGNNNIAVKMNRKFFEYGNRTTAVKHAQLRMKCTLLSGHLYDLHVVDSPACECGFDFEDINHFINCPLFGAERTELLTNLLTLGITNVNLLLLLIGCDDYGEELNKNIFKFIHHFIDSTGRL